LNIACPPHESQELDPPKLCQIACQAARSTSFNGINIVGLLVGVTIVEFFVGDNVGFIEVGMNDDGLKVTMVGVFVGMDVIFIEGTNVETGDRVDGVIVGDGVVGFLVGASDGPSTIMVPVGDLVGLDEDFFVGDIVGEMVDFGQILIPLAGFGSVHVNEDS